MIRQIRLFNIQSDVKLQELAKQTVGNEIVRKEVAIGRLMVV